MSFSSTTAPAISPTATGPCEGKTAFVTVGTTEFDSLIRALDDPSVYALFALAGFTRLVMQMGRGQYEPLHRESAPSSLAIDVYRFKPSIMPDIAHADLVIGHAGSGTALEVLEAGKLLVIVVNDTLMHNHQTELGDRLARDGFVFSTTPARLPALLRSLLDPAHPPPPPEDAIAASLGVAELDGPLGLRRRYTPGDPTLFARFLDRLCGFPPANS
jgi:beta-1,4-N-acetylglucosaminyltransferase